MGKNNLFVGNSNVAELGEPLTKAELEFAFNNNKQIAWEEDANLTFGYDPVPVFVEAYDKDKDEIRFSLINCNRYVDPTTITETFTVKLNDYNHIHPNLPSTPRGKLQLGGSPGTERRILFLMIHPAKMPPSSTGRTYEEVAIAQSVPFFRTGKWPMTTPGALRRFVRLFNKIVRAVELEERPFGPQELRRMRIEVGLPETGLLGDDGDS